MKRYSTFLHRPTSSGTRSWRGRRLLLLLAAVFLLSGWLGGGVSRAEEDPFPPPESPLPSVSPGGGSEGSSSRRGQNDDHDRPYWRTNLFKRVLSDQKFLVTEWWPAEFRRAPFALSIAGGMASALTSEKGGGYVSDLALERRIDTGTQGSADRIAVGFTKLGNGPVTAAILGATYLVSRHRGNNKLAETSSLSAEALIDAGIWITLLKQSFARVRPNGPEEGEFGLYSEPNNGSFPSGHAMGAFAVATVFAEQYRDKRWMPWVAYGTATLIGGSRIALGRHFPSDVVVGGLLGNSIGRAVTARQREDDLTTRRAWPQHLTPIVGADGQGMGMAFEWTWRGSPVRDPSLVSGPSLR